MSESPLRLPITVEIDIPVTRRQKIHAVVDGSGDQIFHAKRITEVFAWLFEQGVAEFTALDEDHEFRVSLKAPLSSPLTEKG